MKPLKRSLILLCTTLLLLGCVLRSATIENIQLGDSDLPNFLSNLEQVNAYPFYTAQYTGDYSLSDYLESGVYPELQPATAVQPAFACSCFFAGGGEPVYGRNFDWYENPALLLFTSPPDGYQSVSMVDISYLGYDREHTPLDDPEGLRYAPYYPFDGMNEHGLVVGMMAVSHAEGGEDPDKVTLGSLEIIRLMLDRARDVPEALVLIEDYNVDFGSVPVHYLIADREGNSAVVEYLDNKIVITETNEPYQVSTNFIIHEIQPVGAHAPCGRYNRLTAALADQGGRADVESTMALLQEVSQSGGETATRWSVVYDMQNLSAIAAINRNYKQVFTFPID